MSLFTLKFADQKKKEALSCNFTSLPFVAWLMDRYDYRIDPNIFMWGAQMCTENNPTPILVSCWEIVVYQDLIITKKCIYNHLCN